MRATLEKHVLKISNAKARGSRLKAFFAVGIGVTRASSCEALGLDAIIVIFQ